MWADVLLALQGISGDLITGAGLDNPLANNNVPSNLLDAGEQQVVAHVETLYAAYRHLLDFIDSSSTAQSIYLESLANEMDKVLGEYRSHLLSIEKSSSVQPLCSLTLGALEPYPQLIRAMLNIINQVSGDSLCKGMKVMDVLHASFSKCGVPVVKTLYFRMWSRVRSTFYRQMSSYVLFGCGIDPYVEFFVADNFEVKAELVPLILGSRMPEQVRFLCKASKTCRDGDSWLSNDEIKSFHEHFNTLIDEDGCQMETFGYLIDDIEQSASRSLWSIVNGECTLLKHLEAFKNYYLLGAGLYYQMFIMEIEEQAAASLTTLSVNRMFKAAAWKMIDDDPVLEWFQLNQNKPNSKKYELVYKHFGSKLLGIQVSLAYNDPAVKESALSWVIADDDMDDYNAIFTVLLSLRQAQFKIQHSWKVYKHFNTPLDRKVWELRHRMLFFLDAFLNFINIDIIEPHYAELVKHVAQASNVEEGSHHDITTVHQDLFLKPVLSKSFFMVPAGLETLSNIVDTCLNLVVILKSNSPSEQSIDTIQANFDRHYTFFKRIVAAKANAHVASSCEQNEPQQPIAKSSTFIRRGNSDWIKSLLLKLETNVVETRG